jgi:hypothetical protein
MFEVTDRIGILPPLKMKTAPKVQNHPLLNKRHALGPGVYSASNRNEYQEHKNNISGE